MTTLQTRPTTRAVAGPGHARARRQGYHAEILLVSFAALLIEVCYTRVISFKLFYYYTYLIIGLALLGIGTGGVLVALSRRLRQARTDTVLLWSFLLGGVGVVVSYVVVAYTSLDSLAIWDYGTSGSARSMGELLAICVFIFVPFVAPGVIIATLFGRRPEGVGSLYFADLVGAGLACAARDLPHRHHRTAGGDHAGGRRSCSSRGRSCSAARDRWRCRCCWCSWPAPCS